MTKQYTHSMTPWMPNFQTYNAAFKLGAMMTEMFMHSAAVIFSRSPIIMDVMAGKLSITDPKFSALWQEKMGAGLQSYNAFFRSMARQSLSLNTASLDKQMTQGMQTMNDYIAKPFNPHQLQAVLQKHLQ
jgi:hypothetical protein